VRRDGVYAAVVVAIAAPYIIAMLLRVIEGAGRPANPAFFWVGAILAVAGTAVLLVGSRLQSHGTKPRTSAEAERGLALAATGIGCYVLAEAAIVATLDERVAVAVLAIAIAWTVYSLLPSRRTIEVTTAVVASTTPAAAFDLVSDPSNWPRYAPDLELVEPPVRPIALGTVIRDRMRRPPLPPLEVQERVIAYEPGRRFGTTVVGDRPNSGVYELREVEGGTEIVYVYSAVLGVPMALLGGAFMRPQLVDRLRAVRMAAMDRIKRLLETESPASV
jgi:polyketide cyclase/dehydrase/lipid transport protein